MGERPPARDGRSKARALRWIRRSCQASLFAFFLATLIFSSRLPVRPPGGAETALGELVDLFARIDPLAALLTLCSSHRFHVAALPSLAVVLLALLLGRAAFCGWGLCPLGTINHFVSWIFRPRMAGERRARNRGTKAQRLKYLALAACLGAALLGSAAGGWVDPIAIATRGVGLFVIPATELIVDRSRSEEATGDESALDAVSAAIDRGAGVVTAYRSQRYQGAWLVGAMLLAIVGANALRPRFWCRVLCPLGALLGLLSKLSVVGMRKRDDACDDCGRCEEGCQGADEPRGGRAWRESECVLCLNCQAECPNGVISFAALPPRGVPGDRAIGVDRRSLLGSVVAGAALVPLSRIGPGFDIARSPWCIRPPGSLDEPAFLARCTRCGLCMKACPTNAIQPALTEAGLEGVLTPVLVMRLGYCEPSCVRCTEICPTGAIRTLTEAEKNGDDRRSEPVRLGTAFVDRGRCLPWAMATPCVVCEELCPTHPKAIGVERVTVDVEGGRRIDLVRPVVDPARCTGCGACEHVCPVETPPAITVSCAGESRAGSPLLISRR